MKILEDSITVDGHVLHRIQADCDIPFHGVKVGDVGGWVEKPDNLQDDAWVTGYLYGDAVACGNALIEGKVFGNAYVQKSARIGQYAKVFDNANIGGDARISGHAVVCGNARISDHAIVTDSAKIGQNCTIMDYAFIGGSAELEEVTVKGFVKFDLPITINRCLTLSKTDDFVGLTLQGKTYVYVKSINTWFPLLRTPPLNIKDSIEKL